VSRNFHDSIPSQKYRDAGIPWCFMTSSTVVDFSENWKRRKMDEDTVASPGFVGRRGKAGDFVMGTHGGLQVRVQQLLDD